MEVRMRKVLLLERRDICAFVGGGSFERGLLYDYLCELFQSLVKSYGVEGVAYSVGDSVVEFFFDASDFARYFCEVLEKINERREEDGEESS